ncbi:MAG TPA: formyltransferase family protein [Ferruginibacter sp.]|nr:formyltransferase family protein [Ferruginibacter sp.]
MSEIKVILLCGSRFALPTMQEMYFFKQLAVIAIPAYAKEMVEETQALMAGSSIPIVTLKKESYAEELTDCIDKYAVNTGLIMTFPYTIPAPIYSLAEKGFYNVHPGPLPEYRGADPVFQQIKNKESKAGVTIHKLDEKLDTGGIVLKEMIRLDKTDTYGLLTAKLAQTAALMVRTILKLVSMDMTVHSKPQDETKARYFKRQSAKDITVDWDNMDAATIVALINACNPWNKGAVTKLNGKIIRLIEGEPISEAVSSGILPGTIVNIDEQGLNIATNGGGSIRVQVVYTDEGFFTAERLRQLGVRPGIKFESI